jgi:hypothetical protein
MFLGMAPLGSFEIGYLTEHYGVKGAFLVNAGIVLLTGFYILLKRQRINAEYRLYKRRNRADSDKRQETANAIG